MARGAHEGDPPVPPTEAGVDEYGAPPTQPGLAIRASRILLRVRLFVSSYTVLFVIMAVRTESGVLRIASVVLAVGGLTSALSILHAARAKGAGMVRVSTVRDRGSEVAAYLATYLLPFVTAADPGVRDIVADVLYLLTAGIVYTSSTMLEVNPTLYCLLLRVTTVRTTAGAQLHVISHRRPTPDSELAVRWLADDVVVA
jgi:hypothetical protein